MALMMYDLQGRTLLPLLASSSEVAPLCTSNLSLSLRMIVSNMYH